MTRRGNPELIYRAQRTGLFNRLRDAERLDEPDAEHWIARWEREAEATGRERGSTGYWDEAGGGSSRSGARSPSRSRTVCYSSTLCWTRS